MQGQGNDLFLYWIADCIGHEGEGGKFSFVEGTNVHEQSRADTCKLRYNTKGFSRFSIMNQKLKFPGKVIYDSGERCFEFGSSLFSDDDLLMLSVYLQGTLITGERVPTLFNSLVYQSKCQMSLPIDGLATPLLLYP